MLSQFNITFICISAKFIKTQEFKLCQKLSHISKTSNCRPVEFSSGVVIVRRTASSRFESQ